MYEDNEKKTQNVVLAYYGHLASATECNAVQVHWADVKASAEPRLACRWCRPLKMFGKGLLVSAPLERVGGPNALRFSFTGIA